jgi:hypothetical protein
VTRPRAGRDTLAAAGADVASVLVFVLLGRRSHDEGSALGGTLEVAAPFLVALAVAWLVGGRRWPDAHRVRFGVSVWGVTVVVGLALRNLAFDRGTAPAFVIVTAVVLGAFLVGWRALFARHQRRRALAHRSVAR